jgi:tetratricopeptide (TPR) repeat protein
MSEEENVEYTAEELWDLIPRTSGKVRADVMMSLAKKVTHRSKHDALALMEAAREIYEDPASGALISDKANAYLGLAYAYDQLDQVPEALVEMAKAIELHRLDGFSFQDDLLRVQAEMFGKVGNWQSALESQLEAVRLNEIEGDQKFLALSFQNAGNCLGELGKFAEAINYYEKAVAIYTEIQDLEEVGNCFEKLAECNLELGQNIEAISYGQRALNLSFFDYESESLAKTHLIMTKAFLAQGDLEASSQHLMDAKALANYASEKNWKLIAEVEQTRINHLKAGGFTDSAAEAEVRLETLRELVK